MNDRHLVRVADGSALMEMTKPSIRRLTWYRASSWIRSRFVWTVTSTVRQRLVTLSQQRKISSVSSSKHNTVLTLTTNVKKIVNCHTQKICQVMCYYFDDKADPHKVMCRNLKTSRRRKHFDQAKPYHFLNPTSLFKGLVTVQIKIRQYIFHRYLVISAVMGAFLEWLIDFEH